MTWTLQSWPDIGATDLSGAGNEARTRDLNLGKVALYQLSYTRMVFILEARSGVEPD
jgi:hypothetical protein